MIADEGRQFGRRIFITILGIGTIGGLIGMKLFRNPGFRKRAAASPPAGKRVIIKSNQLAVSRMNKEK